MFAARSGAAVPVRQAAGAEPAEEHPAADGQSAVPHRAAGLVPGRLRAALRGGPQEDHAGAHWTFESFTSFFDILYLVRRSVTFTKFIFPQNFGQELKLFQKLRYLQGSNPWLHRFRDGTFL